MEKMTHDNEYTDRDRQICADMKEARELLSEFGATLFGMDPGVTFSLIDPKTQQYIPSESGNRWGGTIGLGDKGWQWLKGLLEELQSYRINDKLGV